MAGAEELRLVDHWVHRPEWRDDRRLWAYYLTFGDNDVVADYVAAYQEPLRDLPGIDLVARRWLHLTVLGAAFVDQVDEPAGRRLAAAAIEITDAAAPFDAIIERPRPWFDAVLMPVQTTVPLGPLRKRLADAVVRSLGREPYALPLPPEGFHPHLSIAYPGPRAPAYAEVEARLSRVALPPVTVRVSELSMIRLRLEPNQWSWDGEQRLALSGADRPG